MPSARLAKRSGHARPSQEALGTKGPEPEARFSSPMKPPRLPGGDWERKLLYLRAPCPGLQSPRLRMTAPFLGPNWSLIQANRGLLVTPQPGSVVGTGFQGVEPLAGVRRRQKRSQGEISSP